MMRESVHVVPDDRARLEPAEDTSPALPATLEQIADELDHLGRSVSVLVAQMDDDDASADDLDAITERIIVALARIEQLRCARAWTRAKARSDENRWADYLEVA